jgi:hypothetical protein
MLMETSIELVALAGNTVVAAADADVWGAVRDEFGRLLGRGDPAQTARAKLQLETTRKQLNGARGAGLDQARAAHAERWAGRLAALLEEHPDAEAELDVLVQEIAKALPARMVSAAEPKSTDGRTDLLTIFAAQFNSYTSLLWQVPALALTAQAFLLTIALNSMSTRGATIVASALALLIALASWALMHDQRGLAISHGYFTKKLAEEVKLDLAVPATEDDAEPWLKNMPGGRLGQIGPLDLFKRYIRKLPKGQPVSTTNVWVVPGVIYHAWRTCLLVFMVVNFGVFISAVVNFIWWK